MKKSNTNLPKKIKDLKINKNNKTTTDNKSTKDSTNNNKTKNVKKSNDNVQIKNIKETNHDIQVNNAKETNLKKKKKRIPLSFYFNVLSMVLFIAIAIWGMTRKSYAQTSFKYVAIAFAIIYSIVFVGIIIYMIHTRNVDKQKLKEMKVAGKTFKSTIAISNKLLLLVNIIAALSMNITQYQANKAAGKIFQPLLIFSMISAAISILSIIFFVIRKSLKIHKSIKKSRAVKITTE